MLQLLAHLWGDYLLQSHWMALNKRRSSLVCWAHALLYSLPFLLLTARAPNPAGAGVVILLSHFLIDRFGVARYLVWAKNWLAPGSRRETFVETVERWREMGVPAGVDIFAGVEPVEEDRWWVSSNLSWQECAATGYPPGVPAWLSTWLVIVADNTLHLTCNYIALRWL